MAARKPIDVFKFIDSYQGKECLWKNDQKQYSDRNIRRSAITSLAVEFDATG